MGWEIESVLGPAPFLLAPPFPPPLSPPPPPSQQKRKKSESFSPETHLTYDFFFLSDARRAVRHEGKI